MPADSSSETLAFLLFAVLPVVFGAGVWLFARVARRGGLKPPWLRLIVGNTLVLALLVSLAFLTLESYFRFLRDTTDSFNYTKTSQRWFQRHYVRNRLNSRDNVDYQARVVPPLHRVTFLGDSFTAGHGVADVNVRFANLIRNAAPGLEVHVLAEIGYDTGQELVTVREAVRRNYQFDKVVLVYGLNDISDIAPEWTRTLRRIYADWEERGWLVENSYFANTIYYRWKARHDPDIPNYFQCLRGAYQGPLWQQQQRRLASLHDLVRAAGGRLFVVTFPFLHDVGPDYEWRDVHARLAAFWAERRVPCLDLLPVFETHSPRQLTVNRLDAHPNEYAHALAAEAILKFLASRKEFN